MGKQATIRKQKIHTKSKYPLIIDDDYVFIRDDFTFIFISTINYLISALFIGFIFCKIIGTHKIIGKKNIRPLKKKGFISIANHCHLLDTIYTGTAFRPRMLWYASVQRNFETPYLRKILRLLRSFPIPNGPFGLQQIMKPVVDAVNDGKIIHFYPEAELWHMYQGIGNFQLGAFYLAHFANCPIVPMIHLFKPRTFFGIKLSKNILCVTTVIGEPIYPDNPESNTERKFDLASVQKMCDKAHHWMVQEINNYQSRNKMS